MCTEPADQGEEVIRSLGGKKVILMDLKYQIG